MSDVAVQEIITQAQAAQLGLKHFFTNRPCKNGHVAKRLVSNWGCVECARVEALARYRESPEKAKAASARRRVERRDELLAWHKGYYLKNKDKWEESARKRASVPLTDEQRARRLEKLREHRASNPELYRVYKSTRRARELGAPGSHSRSDIVDMLSRQGHRCAACSTSLADGYHVDHIMPLCLGGSNDRANLQALCPSCNSKKGRKHPDRWAREVGVRL